MVWWWGLWGGGGGEEREAGLLMTWCCVAEAASSDRAAASDGPVLHTDSLITVITPPRRVVRCLTHRWSQRRQGSVMISVYDPKLEQE